MKAVLLHLSSMFRLINYFFLPLAMSKTAPHAQRSGVGLSSGLLVCCFLLLFLSNVQPFEGTDCRAGGRFYSSDASVTWAAKDAARALERAREERLSLLAELPASDAEEGLSNDEGAANCALMSVSSVWLKSRRLLV